MLVETCEKRIVVLIKSGDPQPNLMLLGIQKITPLGSYVIFCADGISRNNYPDGWLYVYDRTGKKIDENIMALPGQGVSTGINPFGLISWDLLPSWLWILLIFGLIVWIKD